MHEATTNLMAKGQSNVVTERKEGGVLQAKTGVQLYMGAHYTWQNMVLCAGYRTVGTFILINSFILYMTELNLFLFFFLPFFYFLFFAHLGQLKREKLENLCLWLPGKDSHARFSLHLHGSKACLMGKQTVASISKGRLGLGMKWRRWERGQQSSLKN